MTLTAQTTTLSECDSVTLSYGEGHTKVTALDDVSLTLRAGQRTSRS